MTRNKGFTLIELLVVIAIIGILASIIIVSLIGVRERARDARRKSDLRSMRTALELYYGKNKKYPARAVNGWIFSDGTKVSTADNWSLLSGDLNPYLASLPTDPRNTQQSVGPWADDQENFVYAYTVGNSQTPQKYDLVARLENKGDKDRAEVKTYYY